MPDIAQIDFKSVGLRVTEPDGSVDTTEGRPIGLRVPMTLGTDSDGIFAMNFSLRQQIRENFRNMLLTNWGERLGLYNFGANLAPMTLELGTEDFDAEVSVRIKTATNRWMSYINLIEMQRTVENTDNQHTAKIKLRIFYDVRRLGITRDAIELIFFIAA